PSPNVPQAFRFQRAQVEELMRGAGLRDVRAESLHLQFRYDSIDQYLHITTDIAGALKAKLATLSESERRRFDALVREYAAPFLTDGGLRLPATPLSLSAVK
ncbi:MAG: hypothetical protein AB1762_01875, partial [Gemmatimonadota bacterium]